MVKTRDLKIKQWVESRFPPAWNIKEYEYPGHKSDLCPFCDEPHDEFKNEICDYPGTEAASFHICGDCDFRIAVQEHKFLGKESSDNMSYKLKLYVQKGELGADALDWARVFPDSCYFCRAPLSISSDEYLINEEAFNLQIPVGDGCNGQELKACETCASVIGYKALHHKYTDSCFMCGESYPITEEEHSFRLEAKEHSIGNYLCPKCFQTHHGTLYQERFIHIPCTGCHSVRTYDLFTITAKNLLPEKATYKCLSCVKKSMWEEIIELPENVYLFAGIVKHERIRPTWMFEICKKRSPNDYATYQVLAKSETYIDAYEAAYKAAMTLHKFLRKEKEDLNKILF